MATGYFKAWRLLAASHVAVLRHIHSGFDIQVVGRCWLFVTAMRDHWDFQRVGTLLRYPIIGWWHDVTRIMDGHACTALFGALQRCQSTHW